MRILSCFLVVFTQVIICRAQQYIDIGSRLELFVDDYLIEELKDGVLKLHEPQKREIVLVHDEPWEGSGSGYHSIFKDGNLYRMYYKAWQHEASGDLSTYHPLFCAYAESKDGIHWYKPSLGLHEFKGSTDNNIVMISGDVNGLNVDAGHPAVFRDDNPAAPADARYKAILVSAKPNFGLAAFKSPDGIHWSLMAPKPIITDGAFDSQNLAFWDPSIGKYRAYWRYFTKGEAPKGPNVEWAKIAKGTRGIRTAVSTDFIHWEEQTNLDYIESPEEELYTNQIKSYHRAPHILIGFPARYIDRGWSKSMTLLPEIEERKKRAEKSKRYGTALTESLLITSRDGHLFKRWNEAFLRPGIEKPGTWTYGDQYIGWHVVETKSADKGAPNELSLYATEYYWKGNASALRRYTLRLDGFVSVNAPYAGAELLTKPFIFQGNELKLNFATSAAGDIYVEILDEQMRPIPGFQMDDCEPVFGDAVERTVYWKKGADVSALAGKPVRLRFKMRDADLYSLRFQ
ncbi:hypothetical protein G5B30_15665 [Sphingobacterium sp. SGG-5]|uniref:hypothetical protein n=1 Tax=Sphingobacterium sp. SGG-5 TaxID=2710881 RepID=UPI0013ED4038|nr:hypothetical protein [Sphingobacterium sp. SGG-5]NGM63347.1 hypothetical protein [Sphingobacterium sp. SGG-5]